MKIKTDKFFINDSGKLEVELLHEFHPFENSPEVVVECEHLKNGEITKFLNAEDKSVNFAKLAKEKIKKLSGVELEDDKGKTINCDVNSLFEIPHVLLNEIITRTSIHLIEEYTTTEEEEKN